MISLSQVEDQLKRVGCNFRFWGRPEIRELCKILLPGEIIAQAVNGRYENGFAMLVATDHRLLLIDKKIMFLTLEDIRFDMIAEMDFSAQLLDGTIKIITPNRTLVFTSWNLGRLRTVLNYTQQRVSDIRQHYMQRQVQPQMPMQPQPQSQFQPLFQQVQPRMDENTPPVMGELALQGDAQFHMSALPPLPINPYTTGSLTMRRRRVPKFY